jgi:hypothetical protein
VSDRTYTAAEKLAAVERALEMYRKVVSAVGDSVRNPSSEHFADFSVLKAVAADYREREAGR